MDATEYRYWRICVWNGPLFVSVFIVFWGLMGHNIPPWNAALPAAEVAGWFRAEANVIRLGMLVAMTFAVCYAVWGIGRVMRHVVHKDSILVDLCRSGARG